MSAGPFRGDDRPFGQVGPQMPAQAQKPSSGDEVGPLSRVTLFQGVTSVDQMTQPDGTTLIGLRFDHGCGCDVYVFTKELARTIAANIVSACTGLTIPGNGSLT